jgi:hypothetical protein
LRTGDESEKRGDTVDVGTMVKRRIGLLPDAPRQGGIEIHTDRARLEVVHPSASTLHFSRQYPSEHFDRAFGDRKIRGSALLRVRYGSVDVFVNKVGAAIPEIEETGIQELAA